MQVNDTELIQQAQHGDSVSFEKLIARYDRSVWQTAYHMLGNLQDTQDMYQETFMRAWEKIGSFRFQSSFKSWLLRITINQCINYRKRKRFITWIPLVGQEDDEKNPAYWIDYNSENPDKRMEQKQVEQELINAMKKLSARERAAFTLKQHQGYKIREIAGIMNCAEGSIKNYLYRAMQKLRKELTPFIQS